MTEIVITSAKRTPIGKFMGTLANLSAPDLGKIALDAVISDCKLERDVIDEVILGQVLTGGAGQNPARQSSLSAGIPIEKSALTVNQVCGSGLRAVSLAAQSILTNQSNIIIAGGQESMSNAHHTINLRNGLKMGDGNIKDSMIVDGLWCAMNDYHMGTTAENIAEMYGITKDEQDKFATESQNKTENAQKNNYFDNEIIPVEIKSKKETIEFNMTNFLGMGHLMKKLILLNQFLKRWNRFAGNASGLNDGSATVILMKESKANDLNVTPLARIISWATVGVDPSVMGIGPVPAVKKALELASWRLDDLDLIEANEAFAAQSLVVGKELQWDLKKVNVNGGAIALGHPIGASGTRF